MDFRVFNLGLVDFKKALQFQKEIFQEVRNNYFMVQESIKHFPIPLRKSPKVMALAKGSQTIVPQLIAESDFLDNALILCRHYPVITMGRQGSLENIRVPLVELKNRGIQMYEIERGGDITYHGPGQLIAYPVFNLNYLKKDIHLFLRQLEGLIIDFLSDFGIKGLRHKGLTGVWIDKSRPFLNNAYDSSEKGRDKNKIASIGIAIRNWITFHGLSINIKKDDLDNFSLIKPCGMDIEMTSLETILGRKIEIGQIEGIFTHKFEDNFFMHR